MAAMAIGRSRSCCERQRAGSSMTSGSRGSGGARGWRSPPNNPNAAGSGWRTARACGCAPSGLTMSGLMTSSRIAPMRGRKYRMLNIIDEFTHECLAIRIDRKSSPSTSSMCSPTCSSCAAFPSAFARTTDRSSSPRPCKTGSRLSERRRLISRRQPVGERLHRELQRSAPGRAARSGRFSIRSRRPGSWSKARGAYNAKRPHASLGYKPPAPEVFIPAFAARAAAQSRPAAPPALAHSPTLN